MRPPLYILGIRLDNMTKDEAVALVVDYASSGQPHHVVTINPEFIMQARGDSIFNQVLGEAHLALADGVGVIWASRLLGHPLKERIPGVDLMWSLASVAGSLGQSLYILGGRSGVAEQAAKILTDSIPNLRIAGTWEGSPQEEDEASIVEGVRAANPHYLFVAFGSPQQDLWIHRNLHRLGVPVAIGVGGSLDYISGRVRRAPQWMRRLGLEWLFRLALQPWRWRRMLRLPQYAFLVIINALRRYTHRLT